MGADTRKYYYMRLKENFFESDEMVILESLPQGYLYSNILLKLYLKSLKNNGCLMFNDCIPYDAQMISTLLKQPIGIVKDALNTFRTLGLIDVLDNGTIYMSNIELFIGQSSNEGERKKAARLALLKSGGQMSDKRPTEIDIDIEKELDIEKEKEIDTKLEKETETEVIKTDTNVSVRQTEVRQIIDEWNTLSAFGIKSVSKISASSQRYKMLVARVKEYGIDDIYQAIENIRSSSFLQGKNKNGWQVDFDWFVKPNNFPKVLDGNYNKVKQESSGSSIWDEWKDA